jgi:hypothetical protein
MRKVCVGDYSPSLPDEHTSIKLILRGVPLFPHGENISLKPKTSNVIRRSVVPKNNQQLLFAKFWGSLSIFFSYLNFVFGITKRYSRYLIET